MDINYTRNLIKGKITEVIFEEMFRSAEEFTVLPIGYEHTVPELAQYQHHVHIQKVLNNLRHAPDFALISQDKSNVFLVEVKYRTVYKEDDVTRIAKDLYEKWNPIFLFLATKDNFYFESCKAIMENNGKASLLSDAWIKNEVQSQYLRLLQEFEA
jgi:hypothetical protein